jgi:DNA-binding LacI/PurR family transcriptional regulator
MVLFAPAPAWFAGYSLSAAVVPTQEMGRRAVQMLLRKLGEPAEPCAPDAIPFSLSDRGSIGSASE